MRKNLIFMLLIISAFGLQNAMALSEPTALLVQPPSGVNPKQPIVYHDSVQVSAWTEPVYHENGPSVWSWAPELKFQVSGPVSAGSVLYAEFSVPGSVPWVRFDCGSREIKEGYTSSRECGGRNVDMGNRSTHTGPVNFAIKLRNELMGGEMTLFTGKTKVLKAPTDNPKETVFYINHDWNMPIGYLTFIGDKTQGWDIPIFYFSFWTRGKGYGNNIYLIYKGQLVGEDDDCFSNVRHEPNYSIKLPQGATWTRVGCEFSYVRGWDNTKGGGQFPKPLHILAKNPGEYEIRVLINNKLARSIKFTVNAKGELENNLGEPINKLSLADGNILVPVRILGDQDGPWDKNAWKTDSFYGHLLTNFTPPQ